MSWNSAIDAYCERVDATLFSEPLNLFSNASFFIAAYLIHRQFKKNPSLGSQPGILFMIFGTYIVGIGSSLFHSFATHWANYADMIPIGVVVAFYFGFYPKKILQFGWLGIIGVYLMLITLTLACGLGLNTHTFNDSNWYFGILLCMFLMGAIAATEKIKHFKYPIYGGCIFAVSLVFRSIDMEICAFFPIGTHFLWHLLNGVVVYVLMKSILDSMPISVPDER